MTITKKEPISQTDLNIYQKIAYVQSKVCGVYKDSEAKTPKFSYSYVSLNEIIKVLHEHLTAQGLAVLHTVEPQGSEYVCITQIHDGTSSVISQCPIVGVDRLVNGNPMQGMGSGISYAKRYNLLSLFNLYSTDDDAASMAVQLASKAQTDTINKLLAQLEGKFEMPAFLQFLGVQSLTGIDEPTAKKAITALQGKLAQVKK